MIWAKKQGARLEYIQHRKSQQNAYIERYNMGSTDTGKKQPREFYG